MKTAQETRTRRRPARHLGVVTLVSVLASQPLLLNAQTPIEEDAILRAAGVRPEHAVVLYSQRVEFPHTAKRIIAARVLDQGSGEIASVHLDASLRPIDLRRARIAELAAYQAVHGKRHHLLTEQIGRTTPGSRIQVAIWLTHPDTSTAVAKARANGHLADAYGAGRRAARTALLAAKEEIYARHNRPVADAVRDLGGTVDYVAKLAPLVFATLSPDALGGIEALTRVHKIYPVERFRNQMASANEAVQNFMMKSAGYTGRKDNGDAVRVAIAEFGRPIQFDNIYLNHAAGPTFRPDETAGPHITAVAGCVAMKREEGDPAYPSGAGDGIAPDVQLLSANLDLLRGILEPKEDGNGLADTEAEGDDVQEIPPGEPAEPGQVIVGPGPDGDMDTTPNNYTPEGDDAYATTENGNMGNLVAGVEWAIQNGAEIVNMSFGSNGPQRALLASDMYVDYVISEHRVSVCVSAGNSNSGDGWVLNPGLAYNCITVGGINDHNTSDLADDTRYEESPDWQSAWIDIPGDHEKPEVSAPAVGIHTAEDDLGDPDGIAEWPHGTSFSSPIVAGMIANMISMRSELSFQPEATKALVIAAATRNVYDNAIENYPGAVDWDGKEGAGTIVINDAFIMLTTDAYEYGERRADDFPRSRTLYVPSGSLFRYVIAWSSYTTGEPQSIDEDVLGVDLNIAVQDASDEYVAWSVTWDNGYEVVSFISPESQNYRVTVDYDGAFDRETVRVGEAWNGGTPTGACCQPDGSCQDDVAESVCADVGGAYQEHWSHCLATGVCCLPTACCMETTYVCCGAVGGVYHGDGSECGTPDDGTGGIALTCPASVGSTVDCGLGTAEHTWDPPTGIDSCEGDLALSCWCTPPYGANCSHLIQDGGDFSTGVYEFHCETYNSCGDHAECDWTVTVSDQEQLDLTIQLEPTVATADLNRCIQFEFYSPECTPAPIWQENVTFGGPGDPVGTFSGSLSLFALGPVDCVVAFDPLHTLPSVSPATCVDGTLTVSFQGDPQQQGNWLVGGNLNRDSVIDILDFGVFYHEYMSFYSPDTYCWTSPPHGDLNSDGIVDSLDFWFIMRSFFVQAQPGCCDFGTSQRTAGGDGTDQGKGAEQNASFAGGPDFAQRAQAAGPELSLITDATDISVGDEITINVEMVAPGYPIAGGQFFLDYDGSILRLVSANPGAAGDPGSPFNFLLHSSNDLARGYVDCAVSVYPFGGGPTQGPASLATITFEAIAEGETYVRFRDHDPPARLSDDQGTEVAPVLSGAVSITAINDCNGNGIPDECDPACGEGCSPPDCGTSEDCTGNGVPDECEPDCNDNGAADSCDIAGGSSEDCTANGVPDECEPDCNGNGTPDSCDIDSGTSVDCNHNDVPDECEPDCNTNLVADACDISSGHSADCNQNAVPDECDVAEGTSEDCTENGTPDECEPDCDLDGEADSCEILSGSPDCNLNSIPDECEPDCNGNGVADGCDIASGSSQDCNSDGFPDECQFGGCCLDGDGDDVYESCSNAVLSECVAADGVWRGPCHRCSIQSARIVPEGTGDVFVHVVEPPVDCLGETVASQRTCQPGEPVIDAWHSNADGARCHNFGAPGHPIPADFFGPGSDPFTGSVCLEGVPLGYPEFGNADTLIERSADPFDECELPSTREASVTVEVAGLSLASVVPISITYNGGQGLELWNVSVGLSATPVPAGTLTATKTHCNGGMYTSILNVQPLFTFTKADDPVEVRVLDTGSYGMPYVVLEQSEPMPWAVTADPELGAKGDVCSRFHAGIDETEPTLECDCNNNDVHDTCDVGQGTSQDCNSDNVPDECVPPIDPPSADTGVVAKNRYLSFCPGDAGQQTALRVTITDMPPVMDEYEGCRLWVDAPRQVSESSGDSADSPAPTIWAAPLKSGPSEPEDYRDWSTVDVLHVYSDAIVPGATYDVQAVDAACDTSREESFSAPLTISTSDWGDVADRFDGGTCTTTDGYVDCWTAPDGDADFDDITAIVDKFKNLPGAPTKSRTDIVPEVPDQIIDFVDIPWEVDAFRGLPYPYPGPSGCP